MSIEMNDVGGDSIEEEVDTSEQIGRFLDTYGFGKYQWRLLAISFVGVLASAFVMVNSHYVLNIMVDKFYAKKHEEYKHFSYVMLLIGIMLSSVFFGFLSDCFGRRKITIYCFAGLTVATLFKSAVQNYETKVFAKFCEGIFLGGTFVASTTLQAEFQPEKSRDRIMFTMNFFIVVCHLLVLLLDLILLAIFNIRDYSNLYGRNWDVCMSLTSLVSLVACLLYALLPESPKYDFSNGHYENALQTLKKIYSVNTGRSGDEFPYQLIGMTDNTFRTRIEKVQITWSKEKLLLKKPLLKCIIVLMAAHLVFALGYNTMILWHPTLLSVSGLASRSKLTFLCNIYKVRNADTRFQDLIDMFHYFGNYIGTFVFGLVPYFGILIFINRGKKFILFLSICVCCGSIISMYWVKDDLVNLLEFGIFLATGQSFLGITQAIVVEKFPVFTKSFSLSLVLTMNTMGIVLADVMMSSLLQCGCAVGFIATALMACAAIFILFLPK